jgi:hypothetical protein
MSKANVDDVSLIVQSRVLGLSLSAGATTLWSAL